jgi:hypothetical protein
MLASAQRIILSTVLVLAFASESWAHEIPWPRGMSRQIVGGSCANGPCVRRLSRSPSVPHKHVVNGKCIGLGAAGYTTRRQFDCLAR